MMKTSMYLCKFEEKRGRARGGGEGKGKGRRRRDGTVRRGLKKWRLRMKREGERRAREAWVGWKIGFDGDTKDRREILGLWLNWDPSETPASVVGTKPS